MEVDGTHAHVMPSLGSSNHTKDARQMYDHIRACTIKTEKSKISHLEMHLDRIEQTMFITILEKLKPTVLENISADNACPRGT